jgi:SPP1 gp7 family putative phage head morphogenesis protein
MLSKKQQNKLLKQIHEGELSKSNLPEFVFVHTFEELIKEVNRAFGGSFEEIEETDPIKPKSGQFTININVFSGAKTSSEVAVLNAAIFDEKGNKLPFSKFKEIGRSIDNQYNDTWLKIEQDMAFGQSQSAERWVDIQEDKEDLPLLQYITVGDERVRQSHAAWDGIIRPVDDPFWDTRMPKNDWGCRCRVIKLEEGDISNLKGVPENESDIFDVNPGKVNFIFDPKTHPYFKNATKRDLNTNFGLGFK